MDLEANEKYAHEYVTKLAASARAAIEESDKIKAAAGSGGRKEIKPMPETPKLYTDGYGNRHYFPAENCTKTIAEWFAKCEAIHKENVEAMNYNKGLLELAVSYMHGLGLQDRDRTHHGYGSRRKTEWETAGWLTSLRVQLGDGDNFNAAQCSKAEMERGVKERAEKEAAAQRATELANAAEEKKRKAYAVMGAICGRYGVDPAADMATLLYAIIEKNKYLRLAYYLAKNRGDCSDGPDYARMGLNGFPVETARDKEIADEIGGYIDEWDGDGRIFRDCTWNYDTLFAIVQAKAPELYADYVKVKEYVTEI